MRPTCASARRAGREALTVSAVALACVAAADASDQAVALVRFQAAVGPGTSLSVSDQRLLIEPGSSGRDVPVETGTIGFRAAARTSGDGDVVLTVEPLGTLQASAGSGDTATTISFLGRGAGVQDGVLRQGIPQTVARWVGSGVHRGSLTFVASGPLPQRGASVPLRFLLTAP